MRQSREAENTSIKSLNLYKLKAFKLERNQLTLVICKSNRTLKQTLSNPQTEASDIMIVAWKMKCHTMVNSAQISIDIVMILIIVIIYNNYVGKSK